MSKAYWIEAMDIQKKISKRGERKQQLSYQVRDVGNRMVNDRVTEESLEKNLQHFVSERLVHIVVVAKRDLIANTTYSDVLFQRYSEGRAIFHIVIDGDTAS